MKRVLLCSIAVVLGGASEQALADPFGTEMTFSPFGSFDAVEVANVLKDQASGNEPSAISSLKTLVSSQAMFYQSDLEDDDMYEYSWPSYPFEGNVAVDNLVITRLDTTLTIDFETEPFSSANELQNVLLPVYNEDGFAVTSSSSSVRAAKFEDGVFIPANTSAFPGLGFKSAKLVLVEENFSIFDLASLDLVEPNSVAIHSPVDIEVIGRKSNNSTVSQTLRLDALSGAETFPLVGFDDVVEITIGATNEPVPSPFAAGLEIPIVFSSFESRIIIQTVDPVVESAVFMLQLSEDGEPIFTTNRGGGSVLGPVALPLESSDEPFSAALPEGQTVDWGVYDQAEFLRNLPSALAASATASEISTALSASYLETLEFADVTAKFDVSGRLAGLVLLGERRAFNFDNFERLLGVSRTDESFNHAVVLAVGVDSVFIPEPSTLTLAVLALLALLAHGHRRHRA